MKLTELLMNQKLIIQLIWGEQKIEFSSEVIGRAENLVFVSPYIHNGSVLEIDVSPEKGVVCNVFTDNPYTGHRISWKSVELKTVVNEDKKVYCLKTSGFNGFAKQDDRRRDGRIVVQIAGKVLGGQSAEGLDVLIHDISDVGISFYAPDSFNPKTPQLMVTFTDSIDEKQFNAKVDCVIARTTSNNGKIFVGCRILGVNKEYQLYGFMKKLIEKKKLKFE